VTVPRELCSWTGRHRLGGVFLHLRAELNFYRLFNEAIEIFDHAGNRAEAQSLASRPWRLRACHSRSGAPTGARHAELTGFWLVPPLPSATFALSPTAGEYICSGGFDGGPRQGRICDRAGNDLVEHEATYKSFVQLAYVGSALWRLHRHRLAIGAPPAAG